MNYPSLSFLRPTNLMGSAASIWLQNLDASLLIGSYEIIQSSEILENNSEV